MSKREEFGKIFIYFVLSLWFGTEVLFNSTLDKLFIWKMSDVNDQMALVVLVLLMIQIVFFQQYTVREVVIVATLSLPIIYATMNSDHNKMMSTWIFIIAAKYIDFDRIIRIAYYIELVMTVLVIYLFLSGVITEYTLYRGSMIRHSLGFNHPNQLGIRLFLLIVCRCYIRLEKLHFLDWLIVIATAIFVNRVANSKTSFYALLILALIIAGYEFVNILKGSYDKYSGFLIFIAALSNVCSIYLSVINLKKHHIINHVNKLLSFRFSQCHRTMQYYGIKLFGQDVKLIFSRPGIGRTYHFWLDNAYMTILLRYGLIVFAIFSALYIITMHYLKRTEQHFLVAILCLYAIYGIMENNFFSMSQNLFLLLLSYPIYKNVDVIEAGKGFMHRVKITW
jgi:hypothetical protein